MSAVALQAGAGLSLVLKTTIRSALLLAALLATVPAFAQTPPAAQHTDGEATTLVGQGSQAHKQQTDGEAPIVVGPGSRAYAPQNQSMASQAPQYKSN